ncbi:MAG: hypothetical protein ACTS5V_11035, partial [Giesbergeria sp.]
MLEISQISSLLQTMGPASAAASKNIESFASDRRETASFFEHLQTSLEAFTASTNAAKNSAQQAATDASQVPSTIKTTVSAQAEVAPT